LRGSDAFYGGIGWQGINFPFFFDLFLRSTRMVATTEKSKAKPPRTPPTMPPIGKCVDGDEVVEDEEEVCVVRFGMVASDEKDGVYVR